MPLSLSAVSALSERCAPAVAPTTLVAVAWVESRFEPLAIGVNGARAQHVVPATTPEAIATAQSLIARGANIDLGLAQINVRSLVALGMSPADAFEPCRNLQAAALWLRADYQRAKPTSESAQSALRTALSLYNTGDPARGVRNGYVGHVSQAAAMLAGDAISAAPARTNRRQLPAPPPTPPWRVFAGPPAGQSGFVFNFIAPGADQ